MVHAMGRWICHRALSHYVTSLLTTIANRRKCTDDSEFTKSRSEYSGYLTNAGYKTPSTDKAFNIVENLSQKNCGTEG